jgi:surfactin synthase thioesterase subunit
MGAQFTEKELAAVAEVNALAQKHPRLYPRLRPIVIEVLQLAARKGFTVGAEQAFELARRVEKSYRELVVKTAIARAKRRR